MTSIGATGHRFLSETGSIIRGIDTALNKIREAFPGPFELYTSLAEGADRLVTSRALLILQTRLVVPLPLPLASYLVDFSPDSQVELTTLLQQADEVVELPLRAKRASAYEAAGLYMLDHVDVLIAVWDGQAARGRGGTGQIVAEARQRGMPVAWVLSNIFEPGILESIPFDLEPSYVRYERFPKQYRTSPTSTHIKR